jgi:hydroxymethylbilane synthase
VNPIRIATRGSDLALAQARWVATQIARALGLATELVVIRTSGDRLADVPLAQFGGKGLFVKEIEEALLEEQADVAVHSAKDLPAALPSGLALAAFPERADPRDALAGAERGCCLSGLASGARVGTGSARRQMWLRARYPHLDVRSLRGNVPTRLRRLERGDYDAVILAGAGLDRLGLSSRIDERLAPEVLLPAVGQGTLALETRHGDPLRAKLAALNHPPTERAIRAERAFLSALGGDCTVPLAAFAEVSGAALRLRGALGLPDGSRVEEVEVRGVEPEPLGERAAATLMGRGGEAILAELRAGGHG